MEWQAHASFARRLRQKRTTVARGVSSEITRVHPRETFYRGLGIYEGVYCYVQSARSGTTFQLCLLVITAFFGNTSNVGSCAAYWAVLCPKKLALIPPSLNGTDRAVAFFIARQMCFLCVIRVARFRSCRWRCVSSGILVRAGKSKAVGRPFWVQTCGGATLTLIVQPCS